MLSSKSYFRSRMDDLRACVSKAETYEEALALALIKYAKWNADPLGEFMGNGLLLSAHMARDAVFREVDGESDTDLFADDEPFSLPFKEQIEFFEQKHVKPTKRWTDALRGTHDRAFVIAGATDLAMLNDFHQSLLKNRRQGKLFRDFQKDFDRIVETYGWEFKGERAWRAKVIFETNMRTSYMAGRLAQMRDPDVLKLRPWWQYRHGMTRKPKTPRAAHVAWDGIILHNGNEAWMVMFPPNDFLCSCGVVTLSNRDVERLGKPVGDDTPIFLTEPFKDPVTGELVEKVQHVGYGFDYMPGDLWERGLVPSRLIKEAGGISKSKGLIVEIDEPRPINDLVDDATKFKAKPLNEGLSDEAYVDAFLKPFGATRENAVRFIDKTGTSIPISAELFRDREGKWKVKKRGREIYTAMIAEAIRDPDEIWLGVRGVAIPDSEAVDYLIDRRYIRVDPKTGLIVIFQIGEKGWEAVTAFAPDRNLKTKPELVDRRRGGKLLYERKK